MKKEKDHQSRYVGPDVRCIRSATMPDGGRRRCAFQKGGRISLVAEVFGSSSMAQTCSNSVKRSLNFRGEANLDIATANRLEFGDPIRRKVSGTLSSTAPAPSATSTRTCGVDRTSELEQNQMITLY
jgi:hypothetical protein